MAGGLLLPGDETGDCFKFTKRLAELAAEAGVTFQWGRSIKALTFDGKHVTGVVTDLGPVRADAYLLALGS